MKKVIITLAAREAIRQHASFGELVATPFVGYNHTEIELDDEVFEHLNAIDSDISKAIIQVCSGQFGRA